MAGRSRLKRLWEWSKQSENDYWLTRFLFLRILGFTYFFAFLSLVNQLMPLYGSNGLTPIRSYVPAGGVTEFLRVPTLFWFNQSDWFIMALALIGLVISFLVLVGYANVPMLLGNWLIYLSFVNAGQVWLSYGWEIQLLETGLLAVFFVPLLNPRPFPENTPPSKLLVWLLRWLTIRIHLGSGLIKIKGVECWEKLTCLDRFFQTQPIPNPVSPWMHYLPGPFHRLMILYNHLGQLAVPWTAVFENQYRLIRNIGGVVLLSMQVFLVLVGNFAFLNWITIVPIIGFFDDRFLSRFLPNFIVRRAEASKAVASELSDGRNLVNILVVLVVALLSIPIVVNLFSPAQAMNTSFNNWNFVNTYGAFGSVRDSRTELVFEGTRDNLSNAEWKEYDFRHKPDQIDDPLTVIAPYQPRLSWQLWFASMSQPEREPWLLHLTWKLLHNDPAALKLVKHSPFEKPPRYIRIRIYRYELAPPLSKNNWNRELLGTWMQPVSRNNSALERYVERNWGPKG